MPVDVYWDPARYICQETTVVAHIGNNLKCHGERNYVQALSNDFTKFIIFHLNYHPIWDYCFHPLTFVVRDDDNSPFWQVYVGRVLF